MRFSIITPTFNSAATFERTLTSVVSQTHTDYEYIIIDGGSTDGTLALTKKYSDKISLVVSEPDQGIYDAMNKGIRAAHGDIIAILNSDDFYIDQKVLTRVADFFTQNPGALVCYSDLIYVNRYDTTKVVRHWRPGMMRALKWWFGWTPPHPTFFVRREVYERYGLYRTDFAIAADYEYMIRILKKNHVQAGYIPHDLVCMSEGGYSAKNIRQRFRGWCELYRAWRVNGLLPPPTLVLTRIFSKLPQYFV